MRCAFRFAELAGQGAGLRALRWTIPMPCGAMFGKVFAKVSNLKAFPEMGQVLAELEEFPPVPALGDWSLSSLLQVFLRQGVCIARFAIPSRNGGSRFGTESSQLRFGKAKAQFKSGDCHKLCEGVRGVTLSLF
jgi:hypothetical protein